MWTHTLVSIFGLRYKILRKFTVKYSSLSDYTCCIAFQLSAYKVLYLSNYRLLNAKALLRYFLRVIHVGERLLIYGHTIAIFKRCLIYESKKI